MAAKIRRNDEVIILAGKDKGKKGKKEYESIEDFMEDGEFIELNGFMNILHETEKDKYYLIIEENKIQLQETIKNAVN